MNQFVSAEVLELPHSLQLISNRDSLMGLAVMEKVIAIFPTDTTDLAMGQDTSVYVYVPWQIQKKLIFRLQ